MVHQIHQQKEPSLSLSLSLSRFGKGKKIVAEAEAGNERRQRETLLCMPPSLLHLTLLVSTCILQVANMLTCHRNLEQVP